MKFNPYAVLLTTGLLMLATVVLTQTGPTVASLRKAKVAAVDAPSTDEARHPDTRLASVERQPAEGGDGGRTLED